jgi:hypothetical protein
LAADGRLGEAELRLGRKTPAQAEEIALCNPHKDGQRKYLNVLRGNFAAERIG